jgi:hypothetical protein
MLGRNFFYFVGDRVLVSQAGPELLGPSDPPASVSRVAGTTSTGHHTQPRNCLIVTKQVADSGPEPKPCSLWTKVQIPHRCHTTTIHTLYSPSPSFLLWENGDNITNLSM